MGVDALLARTWVRTYDSIVNAISSRVCYGLYDGENVADFRQTRGDVPVLFCIPSMSDVNGALPHPGVHILQSILRHQNVGCEVVNYNLPCIHPRDPFDHLIRVIRELGVRVLASPPTARRSARRSRGCAACGWRIPISRLSSVVRIRPSRT